MRAGETRVMRAWANGLFGLSLLLALGACTAVPGSGPRSADMTRGGVEHGGTASFVLVDLDQQAARTVSGFVQAHSAEAPFNLPPVRPLGLIGAGDMLQVAIWEPNPNGTSLTADKSNLQLSVRVGADGAISVPYVGRLNAAGRTPAQLEAAVTGRLAHLSPDAQVAVLVTEDVTNAVIVQGNVVRPGRYPVVPKSSGVLDVLAMAGGVAEPNRQALVRITRGGRSFTRTLTSLTDIPAPEGDLSPGDRVLVVPRRAYFQAFGAVASPGEQPYDADQISLARTLARINGLADGRADPAEVFVYRRQPAELTRQVTGAGPAPGQDPTMVIYRLNLRDPRGFFISQQFPVLPDDLLYVSESPISEAAKVFQVINGVSGAGAIPRNLGAQY